MYTTEHAAATGTIYNLQRAGFEIASAYDGGERLRGPMSASAAVDFVRAAEEGSVTMVHPDHGRVTLSMLFQGGNPEEVVCDYSAKDSATLDLVANLLDQTA